MTRGGQNVDVLRGERVKATIGFTEVKGTRVGRSSSCEDGMKPLGRQKGPLQKARTQGIDCHRRVKCTLG